jgi:hypothetical protein
MDTVDQANTNYNLATQRQSDLQPILLNTQLINHNNTDPTNHLSQTSTLASTTTSQEQQDEEKGYEDDYEMVSTSHPLYENDMGTLLYIIKDVFVQC